MKKICITFAGVVGSSKTPIAMYLSGKLNLAVHNNDAIRTEVTEDFGTCVEEEYIKRHDARLQGIIQQGFSFILDASVDREWPRLKDMLQRNHYEWFVISLDLSKQFLTKLHQIKSYDESLSRLDQLMLDHETFLKTFNADVGLHLMDEHFEQRLDLSLQRVRDWLYLV